MSSNYFDLYCTHFYAFCWPIFAFLAILHVCTLCMFPQVLQVRLLSSKNFFSNTHTLFRGRSTRICMSLNFFDLYCTHFYAFCWPIFAFLAILHVCTFCVYPQVTQQVV